VASKRFANYTRPEATLEDVAKIERGLRELRDEGWRNVSLGRLNVLPDGHLVASGDFMMSVPRDEGGRVMEFKPTDAPSSERPAVSKEDQAQLDTVREEAKTVQRTAEILMAQGVSTDRDAANGLAASLLSDVLGNPGSWFGGNTDSSIGRERWRRATLTSEIFNAFPEDKTARAPWYKRWFQPPDQSVRKPSMDAFYRTVSRLLEVRSVGLIDPLEVDRERNPHPDLDARATGVGNAAEDGNTGELP
jgi:hypothetical protein